MIRSVLERSAMARLKRSPDLIDVGDAGDSRARAASRGCRREDLFPDHSRARTVHLLAALTFAVVVGCGIAGDARAASSANWRFLQNSYWYVPEANLPALLSSTEDGGTYIPIGDQTVFHIQNYENGYFWGRVASELTIGGHAAGRSCFQMVGSVTPEGTVNLAFTSTSTSGVETAGFGTMRFILNQWTMENQMSTGTSGGTVSHWAYMAQCSAGQRCMRSLPGTDLTMAELLDSCN